MIDLNFKYKKLLEYLKNEIPFKPEIALILGSGLGDFADNINIVKSIPTTELPNYPESTVAGHKGYLHFTELHNKKVLIFQGRIHLYEGYSIDNCILPAFITRELGCKQLLITNAAGGVNKNFNPGDLMIVTGFLSHNIKMEMSSLFSIPTVEQRKYILELPSKKFNNLIKDAALEENIFMKEGTYWFGKGPSYETPAEIRMQTIYGADAVGMSTVHEAIYAAYHGVEVASISLITNYAAGLAPEKLSHKDVVETAEKVKVDFEKLIKRIVKLLK